MTTLTMKYLALGDSISIDKYTSVPNGGAASQLARKLSASGTEFKDCTRDGETTNGVLGTLPKLKLTEYEVITLTIGGNDFLMGRPAIAILSNIRRIAEQLAQSSALVVMNTVYDPTEGNDTLAEQLGLSAERRGDFREVNEGITAIARSHDLLLCDLEAVYRGHGLKSAEPWIVLGIEPNFKGATAIAAAWFHAIQSRA